MKEETELKLLAYADGELRADEVAEVEALMKDSQAAADLVAELQWARGAMQGNEANIKLPESREFYWSKVSRAIEAEERRAEREASTGAAQPWWRKILVPVAGLAALVFVLNVNMGSPNGGTEAGGSSGAVVVPEPVWEDASVYEFYDEEEKMSVIWVTTDGETKLSTPTREELFRDDEF